MALSKKQIAKIAADNAAYLAARPKADWGTTPDAKAELLARAEKLTAKADAAPKWDPKTNAALTLAHDRARAKADGLTLRQLRAREAKEAKAIYEATDTYSDDGIGES